MENKIKTILVNEQTPVAITKIVHIIDIEIAKTRTWQTILAFFIIVFIGWYCIHGTIHHGRDSQEDLKKENAEQKIIINYLKQLNDSAVYFKSL